MLTFQQFLDTKTYIKDIGAHLQDSATAGHPGYVYLDCLYIEALEHSHPLRYYLLLERSEFEDTDIEVLEAKLYDFAIQAGYTDEAGDAIEQRIADKADSEAPAFNYAALDRLKSFRDLLVDTLPVFDRVLGIEPAAPVDKTDQLARALRQARAELADEADRRGSDDGNYANPISELLPVIDAALYGTPAPAPAEYPALDGKGYIARAQALIETFINGNRKDVAQEVIGDAILAALVMNGLDDDDTDTLMHLMMTLKGL